MQSQTLPSSHLSLPHLVPLPSHSRPHGTQDLQWSFGFNSAIPGGVHNISSGNREVSVMIAARWWPLNSPLDPRSLDPSLRSVPQAIFYAAAHTGVIYDYKQKKQKLLQGHVRCHGVLCHRPCRPL
jgi:hypothetical protein